MADVAALEAKIADLTAAVKANGDRTSAEIAALQAAVDAAKAAANIPDADIAAIQAAIDALNVGAPAPAP